MPEGAVYVGPGTRWGNPWSTTTEGAAWSVDVAGIDHGAFSTREGAARHAVAAYRWRLLHRDPKPVLAHSPEEARAELAGKDLACWCPLDQPCHADVLLEIANAEAGGVS